MDPNSNTSSPKDSRAHLDRRQMFHFLHQTICSDRTDCHMVGWTNGFSDLVNEMILSCYRHRLCSTKCNFDVWYWKGSILEIELFSSWSVHPVTSEACRSKYLTLRSFQPFFCGQLNTRLERFRFKEKVCMTEKSESFYFHFVYARWYFWFRSSLGSGQLRLGGQQNILQKSLLELLVRQKVQVVSEIKSGGWVAHSTQPVRSRREVAKRLQWLHAGRASRILAV